MICHNCSAEIAGSPKFCPKCGAKIQTAAPVAETFSDTPDTTLASSEQANTAPLTAAVKDEVICPTCGTTNLKTARFCKKDGTLLQVGIGGGKSVAPGIAPKTVPKPSVQRTQPANQLGRHPATKSKKTLLLVGFVVVAATLFAGGALYWGGYIGDRQESVGQKINAELSGKGLSNVKIVIDKDWKTVVDGMVASQTEKDQALVLIKQHGELKAEIIDNIRVKPSRAEMEAQLNKALSDAGMSQVTAQIDEGFTTVTLNDADLAPENRAKAEQIITTTTNVAAGGTPVKVTHAAATTQQLSPPPTDMAPGVDETAVTRSLNEQLRNARLGDVSALVDANGNANLQGTVSTHENKDKLIGLALSHPGVTGVGDFIQVAPQTASPAPPPRVAPQTPPVSRTPALAPMVRPDPAKLEGDINRALRDGGVGSITAQVADDFSVTLKGSATSNVQKGRAFQIVRQFGVKGVPKDRVFVVEQ